VERLRWPTLLLIATFAALAALWPVAAAGAATPPAASPAAANPFDFDEEEADEYEGDFDADEGEAAAAGTQECEFDDETAEEACEEEVEERELQEAEAEECRLESAEATVAAVPGRNQLRLTVRYRALAPSTVAVALQLRGPKGALALGTDTARFGRTGTLHSEETLSDAQMARALAAKEFTVGLHAINTPDFCSDAFERHLTARQDTGPGLRWSDPSAARRAKAARAVG
jgi:hypothetical protein